MNTNQKAVSSILIVILLLSTYSSFSQTISIGLNQGVFYNTFETEFMDPSFREISTYQGRINYEGMISIGITLENTLSLHTGIGIRTLNIRKASPWYEMISPYTSDQKFPFLVIPFGAKLKLFNSRFYIPMTLTANFNLTNQHLYKEKFLIMSQGLGITVFDNQSYIISVEPLASFAINSLEEYTRPNEMNWIFGVSFLFNYQLSNINKMAD